VVSTGDLGCWVASIRGAFSFEIARRGDFYIGDVEQIVCRSIDFQQRHQALGVDGELRMACLRGEPGWIPYAHHVDLVFTGPLTTYTKAFGYFVQQRFVRWRIRVSRPPEFPRMFGI